MTNLGELRGAFLNNKILGFESIFDDLMRCNQDLNFESKRQIFPPYNIIQTSDNLYTIELAVAGYSKDDINIELEKNKLTISGEIEEKDEKKYLHKGISSKSFRQKFTLNDGMKIFSADLVDGILEIKIIKVTPEKDKSKKIEIGYKSEDKKFLTE